MTVVIHACYKKVDTQESSSAQRRAEILDNLKRLYPGVVCEWQIGLRTHTHTHTLYDQLLIIKVCTCELVIQEGGIF